MLHVVLKGHKPFQSGKQSDSRGAIAILLLLMMYFYMYLTWQLLSVPSGIVSYPDRFLQVQHKLAKRN